MCTLLLSYGAKVTSKDDCDQTPLHHAIMYGQLNEEFVRVLISDKVEGRVAMVDVLDKIQRTPLYYALLYNDTNVSTVAFLLSHSSQPQSYFKRLNLSLYLRESSRMGFKDLVKTLLGEGADPDQSDDDGKTAVHYAAEGGKDDVACHIVQQLLFDEEKDIIYAERGRARDKYGRNVLHLAAFVGHKNLCKWVLENIPNIDEKDGDGQSAIYYAVAGSHDDEELLDIFIPKGPGANQVNVKDDSQTTPLHMAAEKGNSKMVKKLLKISGEKNKCVTAANVKGQTALHLAASQGSKKIVQDLLQEEAHPLKERDSDGKTALHYAVQSENEKDAITISDMLLNKCESNKQKLLLLFASAVGIGSAEESLNPDSSVKRHLSTEKKKLLKETGEENLLQIAATSGDVDMTRELLTRGASIKAIRNPTWKAKLNPEEQKQVEEVTEQMEKIVEQGTDKPTLWDNLGRNPFANGLAALFLNPFVKSPITVGITGEWGMGKSSLMIQTESILIRTAAQLPFSNSFQKEDFPGASEKKVSAIGQARRKKIAHALDDLLKRSMEVENKKGKVAADLEDREKGTVSARPWLKGSDEACGANGSQKGQNHDRDSLDKFLERYEPKHHQIYKSLAIMDRHDMFEDGEEGEGSGSRNQRSDAMSWEEDWLQGTTPSVLTVRYNAWHYRNESEAWAGLAAEITKELESTMTVAQMLKTNWRYNWTTRRNKICFGVILPCFLALLVAIWLTTILWFLFDRAQIKDHTEKLGYHQKVVADIIFLKDALCYRPSGPWKVFAFLWCLFTLSWKDNYVPGSQIPKMPPAFKDNLRIVIFVDDLDRCQENVILQILSAVHLVLASCEINVILGMDKSMIERAIIKKFGDKTNKPDEYNRDIAEKYLRKIIQLPLDLPDPSDLESEKFLQGQLGVWDGRKGSTDSAAQKDMQNTRGRRRVNPKFQIGISNSNQTKSVRGEGTEYLTESGAKQGDRICRGIGFSTMERQETIRKADENEQTPGGSRQRENKKSDITRGKDLKSLTPEMLIPRYSEGERNAFRFLHTRSSRRRKLPRDWKCLMTYHRLAWNILSWSPEVIQLSGWQVQLVAWVFVCWHWKHLITTLIQKWQDLGVLIKWAKGQDTQKGVVVENSGPSLRDIVEYYIDDRWPVEKKSDTLQGETVQKKKEDIVDEANEKVGSSTGVEKTSANLPEEDVKKNRSEEDNLSQALKITFKQEREQKRGHFLNIKGVRRPRKEKRKHVMVQVDLEGGLKSAIRKVLQEEEVKDMMKLIVKEAFKEETKRKEASTSTSSEEEGRKGETSLQQGTTVTQNKKPSHKDNKDSKHKVKDEDERKEWKKLKETLSRYNVSMEGIQAFQKFRFYCEPGHLSWPLPNQP